MTQAPIHFPINGPPESGYATNELHCDSLSDRQARALKQLFQSLKATGASFAARWEAEPVPVHKQIHVLHWILDQYADQVEQHGQEESS